MRPRAGESQLATEGVRREDRKEDGSETRGATIEDNGTGGGRGKQGWSGKTNLGMTLPGPLYSPPVKGRLPERPLESRAKSSCYSRTKSPSSALRCSAGRWGSSAAEDAFSCDRSNWPGTGRRRNEHIHFEWNQFSPKRGSQKFMLP